MAERHRKQDMEKRATTDEMRKGLKSNRERETRKRTHEEEKRNTQVRCVLFAYTENKKRQPIVHALAPRHLNWEITPFSRCPFVYHACWSNVCHFRLALVILSRLLALPSCLPKPGPLPGGSLFISRYLSALLSLSCSPLFLSTLTESLSTGR